MEHGKVVIGAELSTAQLEKDLNKSKKELEKFEREEENLLTKKQKLEIDVTKSENALQSLDDKLAIVNQRIADMKEANLPKNLETNVDYQKLLAQYNAIDNKAQEYYQALELQKTQITQINSKLKDNALIQNELNATISSTSKKIEDFVPPESSKWGEIEGKISGINNNLSQTVKKVAHWGIAVFGIRTAYDAVRSAMNTLSQYDTQMADNIKYIQYALANTLLPVIQTILNLVVRLLQYINYIAKAWTGKNLFKTADVFKSAQKSASGVAQSAKEINKQLAGFDEMNVLSDTSSSGAGGAGGADISAPNIDLTGMQGEVPQWLQWIVDNKDIILSVMTGVAAGLLAWKLGLKGLQSLGIGIAIAGIIYTIQAIIDYLNDPSFENFGKVITGIGIIVAGIAIAFGAWPVAIAGAIIAVVGIIVSNWEKIKKFLTEGINWLRTKGKEIFHSIFGDFLDPIYDGFVDNIELVIKYLDKAIKNAKKIFDNIIDFIKNVFKGDWKAAWENIKNIFSTIFDTMKDYFFMIFNIIKNVVVNVAKTTGNIIAGVFKAVVNGVLWTIETVLNSPIRTINSLIGVINKIPGINLGKLKEFKLPRLAKGGIINQPGRGIPVGYGQAIAGERRAEGVIPLTDSQQMQLLGKSIGRYVTINASITNTMNGRVISRELQKVNNTNNFAFNS